MLEKSCAVRFTLIVCSVVWATDVRSHVLGNEDSENGYAEVRRDDLEYFEQEIIVPVEVNTDGQPLDAYGKRKKRDIHPARSRYFLFEGFGESLHLEVDSNSDLLAPNFKIYHRNGNQSQQYEEERKDLEKCLFRGRIKKHPNSVVAINLCGGMTGLLKTGNSDYLIEPIGRKGKDASPEGHHHLLTKRSINHSQKKTDKPHKVEKDQKYFCGRKRKYMPHRPKRKNHWLPDEFISEKNRSATVRKREKRWTYNFQDDHKNVRRHHHLKSRRSVETLVVADREMVKKHGTENVTSYLLTVFNMVSMLYQDSSIGNNVSVILVGIVLLEGDEPGLSLSHNAENSLSSFCQWQSTIHTSKGGQHDHAVLVTGLDICSWKNEPCDTLGYAPISGMCSKYRSCTLNEDSGLALAFTVAHEIGHNFGMVHDGQGDSPCRRKRGTLMSASLSGLDTSVLWSDCSRRDLSKFLEYGLPPSTLCLATLFEYLRDPCV